MNKILFSKSIVVFIMFFVIGASCIPIINGNDSIIEKVNNFRNNLLNLDFIEKINNLKSSYVKNFPLVSDRLRSNWTATELVSSESTLDSIFCSLGIDDEGNRYVVWEDETDYGGSGSDVDIFYKMKPYDGNWTDTEVVSSESLLDSTFASLAVESNGTVHVTWDDYDEYSSNVYYKMKPSGGDWTSAEIISPESCDYSGYSSLFVESDGTLHVAITGLIGEDEYDIYYRTKPPGGYWSAPEIVTFDTIDWTVLPNLYVESDGSVHIVWEEYDGYYIPNIYYKMKPSDGDWTSAEAVTQTGSESFWPRIVVDQDSDVHVVWSELDLYYFYDICYKTKPSGGVWSSTYILSSYSMCITGSIDVGSDDTIHVVWNELEYDFFEMLYKNKPNGGSWSNKEYITDDFQGDCLFSSVKVNPFYYGSVHVVWQGYEYYNTFEYDYDIFYKNNGYVNLPPETPNNPSPSDGAEYVDPDADLSWTGGDPNPGDTVTYDVYFGTISPPPKIASNQTDITYDPGTMGYNTQYYWQIVAWDNFDLSTEGPIWEFTTEGPNNPPDTPSNPNPIDGETNVDINTDLTWTGGDPDPGDTVTYDVYFGTTSSPPMVSMGQYGTTYEPGLLNFDETYYWKIVAWDNHGDSSSGPIWSFTTRINNPPDTPSNPSPQDGATEVDVNAILSWDCSDPDGDDLFYDVYFGISSNPPLVAVGITENFYDPDTMDYDETYYWKIVAKDEFGATTTGPIWSFTTGSAPNNPPYIPSDPVPSNGSIDCYINIDLSWSGGDPDPDDTVVYDVYLDANNPNPTTKVSDDQSETTYDPGSLEYSTTYYWKIHAKDNHNMVTRGPVWHFTTEKAPNVPPDKPIITGPNSLKIDEEGTFEITASDSNGDQIYFYVDWGDGSIIDWDGLYNSGEEVIYKHTWTSKDTYKIKVKAKDTYDAESEWSEFEIKITNPRTKASISSFWLRFIDMFPILQRILNLIK